MADTPVRSGWLEAAAGIGAQVNPFARLELGWRPAPAVGVFGFGHIEMGAGWLAGVGARAVF